MQGSAQALRESLENLSTEEVHLKIINAGIGGINESDVVLANASNAIIMGRSTWTSIGSIPLKNRYNCILSNSLNRFEGSSIYIDNDLTRMITTLKSKPLIDNIYIIGGSKVYEEAFKLFEKSIECVYLNIIHKDYECDRKIILQTSYIPVSCETEKVFESRSKEWVDMDKCIYEYTDWKNYLP